MLFCPNCSASLEPEDMEQCWNCHASFGPESAWTPVPVAPGEFRLYSQPRKKPLATESEVKTTASNIVDGIGQGLAIIFVGAFVLLGLLILFVIVLDPCIACK